MSRKTMTPQVKALSGLFPEEVQTAVKGFDDKIRQAILGALSTKGDLSFIQLRGALGISKSLLSHHLDILLDSALIRNYSPSEFRGRFDSYYSISPVGDALLDSLSETFALGLRRLPESNLQGPSSAALKPMSTSTRSRPLLEITQSQDTSAIGGRK